MLKLRHLLRIAFGAFVALAGVPGIASASGALDAMTACRKIADDAERLRCYDQVELSTVNAAAKKTPEQTFGFSAAAIMKDDAKEPELPEVQAKIASVVTGADGKMVFALDNGQVWRKLAGDSDPLLRPGSSVSIRRAALGSYLLVTTTGRTSRVTRVR